MLWITPYLGLLVLAVSIGGLSYPILGYFLPLVFATLFLTALVSGRWFCGNLCPRGSFNDFWLLRISRKRKIPAFFKSMPFRVPAFLFLIGLMIYRILQTEGTVEQVGMVFVSMCILTTAAAIILGVIFSPRAWCRLCPMGTLQAFIGGGKRPLNFDPQKCVNCGVCKGVCPMQLDVNTRIPDPDCIRCERCINECPKKALSIAN